MYQNLVRSVDAEAPESVHHQAWPTTHPGAVDATLIDEMALVLRLVSLGHAARNLAGRKLRQPLQEAAFALRHPDEAGVLQRHAGLIADELNVKAVRPLDAAAEAVEFRLNPLPRQLGQKYGARFPQLRTALLALDPERAAGKLAEEGRLEVRLGEDSVVVLAEEVEVRMEPRAGFSAAADGPYLAALRTELTPELVEEGLAREVVRRIQELRRQAEYDVDQRIRVEYDASPALAAALLSHGTFVAAEVLADSFEPATLAHDPSAPTFAFDDEELRVRIAPS
jgi:isoleucyl-tRNA synthetase